MTGKRVSVLAVLVLVATTDASAQTNTGELRGIVRDHSGAVVPGAAVTAVHDADGAGLEHITDDEGRFFFPALRPGQWDVTVAAPGFAPAARRGVVLELGRILDLDFTLRVQGLAEQITVAIDPVLLQRNTAEISDVIDRRQVVQFPLNARNFLALAQLSSSVVLPPGGTRGDALQQAGALPNVGGQRSGHNIYLLDGAKVTDELFNNLVVNPPVDSIEAFSSAAPLAAP
jgi:hypothetical protein